MFNRFPNVLLGTLILLVIVVTAFLAAQNNAEVEYRLSFPAPEHRWLEVEVLFSELSPEPLVLRMSSASPGRYARHEFAKNLIEITFRNGQGSAVEVDQLGVARWEVSGHAGSVRVNYRLFGDRVDGTYLGVDSTHAHMNLPATLLWAEGLERRPVRVSLIPPPGDLSWDVATQLYPTADPHTFTAPNLAYLLDSPIEFSGFELRTFVVPDPSIDDHLPTFKVAVHHDGDAGVTPFVDAVERIVREMVTIYGEFPRFETGTYTFIADYTDTASSDAMEHRNSTVLTSNATLDSAGARTRLLESAAHEFFHAWNVERIRPRSLEPFDFTDANVSGELWLAEGVTNYYGALVLKRAGLITLDAMLERFSNVINTVALSPGRRLNSVVEMSRMAPFTDAATAIDRTNFGNTFISYYIWGEAIGIGLDLALREHTSNRVSLDDYMAALWTEFGRSNGGIPGVVDRPYTAHDAQWVLGLVASDSEFADQFFARYIDGREVVDYTQLFQPMGIAVQPINPGVAMLGDVQFNRRLRVDTDTAYGSPLYDAGVARGDQIESLAGRPVVNESDIDRVLESYEPGDRIAVTFTRLGQVRESSVSLTEDGRMRLVPVESLGQILSTAQRDARERWLGSKSGF